MNKKLLVSLSVSALMLSFSFFYYLVIYSPRKAEERRLEDIAESKQKKIEEATKYCLQKHDKVREEALKAIDGLIGTCNYTGVCTPEEAIAYANNGKYEAIKDPRTNVHRDAYIKNCVSGYPIK
jgi:hypothetical protein